ncbi:MAG: hypothetical protein GC145_14740 [Caulobacter sp.]|nr:hypothetical protein [Caulobacter sp.]
MASFGTALAETPEFYPQKLDPVNEAAFMLRLSPGQYAAASFLDDRVITPGMTGVWSSFEELSADAANINERCDFIFHVGHVGSTLLSRLLGAFDGLHCLREPAPLPVLAEIRAGLSRPESLWSPARYEAWLSLCLGLWSRTFHSGQTSLVKATSWAGDLAPSLMARPSRPRAIAMTVAPAAYLAAILGSAGGRADIRAAASPALARLHARLGEAPWRLHRLSTGERTAMVWLSEMLNLDEAGRVAPDRLLWVDFDVFLAAPAEGLTLALDHLGQSAAPDAIEAVVAGPLMSRYSKRPQQAFDSAARQTLLASSRLTNAREIARGQAWLDDAARRFPAVKALLARHHGAVC